MCGFFKNNWNILDSFIVVTGWVSHEFQRSPGFLFCILCLACEWLTVEPGGGRLAQAEILLASTDVANFSILRALRILRPLSTLARVCHCALLLVIRIVVFQ